MCLSKSKGQHYKREKDDLNMKSGNRLTVLMSLDAFPCTGIDIIDISISLCYGNLQALHEIPSRRTADHIDISSSVNNGILIDIENDSFAAFP